MEDKDEHRRAIPCRTAQWLCVALLLLVCLSLHTADAQAAGSVRHYELEAGDASVMLNEFSRQSDLQVLFDFNILRGMKTRAVTGDLDASTALKTMLKGTDLVFDFVNDHTLAVTPRKPSFFERLWHRMKTRPTKHVRNDDDLEQVLISGSVENGTQPLLGAPALQFGRTEIERSGFATPQDFLRTLPQVFGGGPNLSTVLGRETQTNSNAGVGVNIRGLDAGATLVLIDGRRVAPSGTEGAFDDISNIPLSIVDHIDILPDAVGARYGADAVGGVVNFVTRRNFSGLYTQARDGGVTDGHMGERQFSQLFGHTRESGSDFFSFEYFQRDALRAEDRWQETSDLTPYGGSNFNVMYGSPGNITDGVHYWPLPKVQNGTSLTAASLTQGAPNLYDQDTGRYITPREQRWSLFGKDSLKLTDAFELFTEELFTRRTVRVLSGSNPLVATVPESNPFYVNPTGLSGPVTVLTGTGAFFGPTATDNRIDTGNFSFGATTALSHGWTASGSVAYAFERQHGIARGTYNRTALDAALADPNPATAFNPFGDGTNTNPATLAAVAATALSDSMSTLKTAGLTARGATLDLPGGVVEATIGTEYRIQSLETNSLLPGSGSDNSGRLSRNIVAGFGELRIPLIGEANELRFARRLELSAGIRSERYTDIGSVTLPKLGLLWSLRKELNLRATWTKSFKPPNLADTIPSKEYNQILLLPDPSSPTGLTNVLARFGTNPDLRPESARTWTLGADFAPKIWPGASFVLTYFNISYTGRINQENLEPDVLSQPNLAWLVNRDFTQAELDDACSHGAFQGAVGTCTGSQVGAIVDNRLRNVAVLKTSGLDLMAKYSFGERLGKFDLGLNATYLFNYSQRNTPGSPLVDIVSTQNHPIDLRVRGSVAWTRRGVGLATFVNFQNSYRDTQSVPNRGISPWTTVDLQLSYETPAEALGWLGHMQFALNAQNLFDVYPPFLNNPVGVGYDQENADLYGRLVSFEVRKRW
jgi:iron complex outermembrane recepter protein